MFKCVDDRLAILLIALVAIPPDAITAILLTAGIDHLGICLTAVRVDHTLLTRGDADHTPHFINLTQGGGHILPIMDSRHFSRFRSPYSRSPVYRRDRSYSPDNSRDYPYDDHYRRSRYRSVSRCRNSRRNQSRSYSPRPWRRSFSPSVSPGKKSRRSYSRSVSQRRRRSGKHSYTSKQGRIL